ncbi:MAG: DUF192 domain-containing protein [Phycisphaerae bacterium]|nr:DUF192 domain-containing protein [Phycisphaerae bacterium]
MLRTFTLLSVLLPIAAFSSCRCSGRQSDQSQVRIGEHVWRVEIADDEQTLRQGLADRDEIPEGTGMLFVFPREDALAFHMLNCRTSIDVAFISSNGVIVQIYTMPVEKDPKKATRLYSSVHPAQYALEVAAGTFERAGVKVGDKVELPDLSP